MVVYLDKALIWFSKGNQLNAKLLQQMVLALTQQTIDQSFSSMKFWVIWKIMKSNRTHRSFVFLLGGDNKIVDVSDFSKGNATV